MRRLPVGIVSIAILAWADAAAAGAEKADIQSQTEACNRECDKVTAGTARADCYVRCNPKMTVAPVFNDRKDDTTKESLEIKPPANTVK